MALFLDASFFIALADPKDQWHAAAVGLLPRVKRNRPWHTHALVVAEVVAVIGSALGGKAARTAYHSMRDEATVHVPALDDLDESMGLVVQYDGGLSLSDAWSLRLMRLHKVSSIVSFDSDFDGKGVERMGAKP
ncbi:MAG TPA: PIN domain-containing protein [Candidatus Thermoplasmatota archaeon]